MQDKNVKNILIIIGIAAAVFFLGPYVGIYIFWNRPVETAKPQRELSRPAKHIESAKEGARQLKQRDNDALSDIEELLK